MKTIHQMWMEYIKGKYPTLTDDKAMYTYMRDAFYAGFNRCYNPMNEENIHYVEKWEQEMDDASENVYKE